MGARVSTGAQSKQDFGTPWSLIGAVQERFGKIGFDLAASAENTKHQRFYSIADNALVQDWGKLEGLGLLWLNPEFRDIRPWAEKCLLHASKVRVAMLTPASVGANWYRVFVFKRADTSFLNDRITFDGAEYAFPKDCMISVFGPAMSGQFEVWSWDDKEKKA